MDLDEETLSEHLPVVMLRYVVRALNVDIRGCLSKGDMAHCLHKTVLNRPTETYYRSQVGGPSRRPPPRRGRWC